MQLTKVVNTLIILFFGFQSWAQTTPQLSPQITPPVNPASTADTTLATDGSASDDTRIPNAKRIRRQLNLIVGVEHDEEFLIPNRELKIKGRTDFFDIDRIKNTDYFRIIPKKSGSGITTLNDKKTGQILVEIRFDIRDDSIEKTLREVKAMLADIEGIEYKIINNLIYIDGFVLIPHDLIRIGQITAIYEGKVRSLATLSPLSWKKIADFISTEVNNPEVKITAVGSSLKLEGQVNSQSEKDRIKQIVSLYIPDIVAENSPSNFSNVTVTGRLSKNPTLDSLIIDLISVKKDDEKVEPPPKMIQIVAHFVKYGDNYKKSFSFTFSPAVSTQSATQVPSTSTFDSTINLLSNLLPRLNWDKAHGYAKVLDTASVLIQDKLTGTINRTVQTPGPTLPPTVVGGLPTPTTINATVSLNVTPTIKSERSGLVELKNLNVTVSNAGGLVERQTQTTVNTTISVRDRQSAAFGGVIKKGTETSFGTPVSPAAIITLNAGKNYQRDNSQFVVFVTPIIKSSASSGVEQVKKKFRLRD